MSPQNRWPQAAYPLKLGRAPRTWLGALARRMARESRLDPNGIVFVSSIRRYGGGERWMLDAASGLLARGHDTRLVARPGSVLAARARSRGIATTEIEMRGDFDPAAIARLAALIRRVRPHAVCPNLDREIRITASAIRLSRALPPRPARPRLVPRRGSEFPLKSKRHYRWVYLREVDRVIVNSEATRRAIVDSAPWFPPEKAVVVHNGIDPGPYEALAKRRDEVRRSFRASIGAPAQAPVLVLVGELNERKQQRLVIDAAPAVLARFPQARFVFVGEGDQRAELEAMFRGRGLEGSVRLLGFRDDVPEIVAASDALLLPSRVEGFGYALIEAMAAGVPCIASDASSIPEIVSDGVTGYLHPVGDAGAIADRIIRLLSSPNEAAAMGERGRHTVRERFSLDRMLDSLESIFFA